jgi:hypothetical protein
MRIILLALLAAFIFGMANAQVTISSADMPVAGHFYTLSTAAITSNIDTSIGANKTWDYSALTATSQSEDTFYGKSSMPPAYQLYFLTSNLGEKAPDISLGNTLSLTNSYNIYKNSTSSFEQTAAVGELNGIAIPIYYTPADVWYQFPLNYNDTSTSNSAYSISIPSIGAFSQQRIRKNNVLGWGSLKLPMGSYDVLLVRTELLDHDSLYVDLLNSGAANNLTTYQYKFIGQKQGVPLLEIDVAGILGFQQVSAITYRDTLTVSGIPVSEPSVAFSCVPNPAVNIVKVFANHGHEIKIIDMTGRTIFSSLVNNIETDIDISSFANGIYLISLSDYDGETMTKKLVIQR